MAFQPGSASYAGRSTDASAYRRTSGDRRGSAASISGGWAWSDAYSILRSRSANAYSFRGGCCATAQSVFAYTGSLGS